MTEGPALSVRGKRVLRFKFVSFKSRCRAFRDGGTGSVGPGFFLRARGVRGFFLLWCRRCRSDARRGDVWDGRSPSLRWRSRTLSVTEGPALSVQGFFFRSPVSRLRFFFSGFSSPCRRRDSDARRGDFWDGRSPSLRDRSKDASRDGGTGSVGP